MSQPADRPSDTLCVCGRSKSLPWCDASHDTEGWQCETGPRHVPLVFCASHRYANLATKLAAHYKGATIAPGEAAPPTDRWVALVDSSDPPAIARMAEAAPDTPRLVIAFGVPAHAMRSIFPETRAIDLGPIGIFAAFKRVRGILDGSTASDDTPTRVMASAFISHAVVDEPTLAPVMTAASQTFGASLFWCADSIPSGAEWQRDIIAALRARDHFIYLLSAASAGSPFCAFEIGMAYAIGKPIHIISLDGTMPPAYAQHLQAIDLPRLQRARPWMDIDDLLLEQVLGIL